MPEKHQPVKKVVKRVVKKPVANKPVTSDETIRFGRPAAKTASKPTATKAAPTQLRRPLKPATKSGTATKPPRPSREWSKRPVEVVTTSTSKALQAARSFGASARDTTLTGVDHARSWRLPRFTQVVSSALVGALVGILTVTAVVVASNIFSAFRGTSTGGGRWGSLAIVVIAFLAFAVGEYLLVVLNVRQPRLTSFLAICLTLTTILGLLLDVFDTHAVWGWVIMPALGAATFAVAHKLIALADASHTNSSDL